MDAPTKLSRQITHATLVRESPSLSDVVNFFVSTALVNPTNEAGIKFQGARFWCPSDFPRDVASDCPTHLDRSEPASPSSLGAKLRVVVVLVLFAVVGRIPAL